MRGPLTASRVALALALVLLAVGAQQSCDTDTGPRSAERLWNDLGCVNCHGTDGTGMRGFGPSLRGKKQYWTRVKLENYLRDPTGYANKDPRLKAAKVNYMSPMPPVLTPDPAELTRIVEHALGMM
jgi:mono/diheme cytochrome c family protein